MITNELLATMPMISWETLTYESWARGEISWKLRPEQRLVKDRIEQSDVQTAVGNISRRWGKSFMLVVISCERARKGGRREKIRYGAAFKSDLEEFILPAFEIILHDCPEEFRPRYIASRQIWVFPDGATIKLVGLDKNPNGMRGNAISCVIVDEAGFVMRLKYLLVSVIWPATMKQKNIKVMIFSTPPESPEHYFVNLMEMAKDDPDSIYFEMDIDTISDLSPEERARLMRKAGGEDSAEAQREYFCKVIIDSTRAIAPHFNPDTDIQAFDPPNVSWMIFGDTGAKDRTVFLRVGYDHETGLVVFRDEHAPPNMPKRPSTTEIVTGYKEKWKAPFPLVADMVEQLRVDYSALGLPAAIPQRDDFDAGLLLINNAFFNRKIVIHPDCDLLIRTLKGGLLKKNRGDFERTEGLGHCDAVAAAIYALRGVDKITDIRPRPDPVHVFQLNRESEYDRNIKGLSWKGLR